jgi:hypothetical protein
MKWWKYLGLFLLLLIVGIQFVPNKLPEISLDNPDDLIQSGIVSGEVAGILKSACYDCHSNETQYPWYSYIAPTSWLVSKDVKEGREALNFSNWKASDMMQQLGILDDVAMEVEEERMPMDIYIRMHKEAKLSEAQRELIVAWAEDSMDRIVEESEEDEEEYEDEED